MLTAMVPMHHTPPSIWSSVFGVSPTDHIGWRFQALPVLVLAGLLLATAPSCNNSEQEESDEKEESAALEPDSMLTVLFPDRSSFTGDLDSLAMYGVVRVLVPYSNTLYFLDGARQRGLIYEYMKGFESYLRKNLRRRTRPMHVVFLPVRREQLLQLLINGYGDIAAGGLTVTEERQKIVEFCTPISYSVNEIVVSAKRADSLATLEDLAGREIYVRKSSSYFEHLQILNNSFIQRDLPPVVLREADESLETEDILEMVNAGVIQMTVADDYIAEFWSGVFDSMVVHSEIIVNAGGSVAPAVRKENPKLKEVLNGYIAANKVGSLFTNVLLQRYFRNNRWAKDPTAGRDRRRLEQTLPLFRKYGEQYDFDYILLTALAYQESRLRQNLRSHAGAVGVMQVKPSTAAAPPDQHQECSCAREQHPRWCKVSAAYHRGIPHRQGAVGAGADVFRGSFIQCRTDPHRTIAVEGRSARLRPALLVRQCGGDSCQGDRAGNSAVRCKYSQVLHCISDVRRSLR